LIGQTVQTHPVERSSLIALDDILVTRALIVPPGEGGTGYMHRVPFLIEGSNLAFLRTIAERPHASRVLMPGKRPEDNIKKIRFIAPTFLTRRSETT